MCVVNLPFKKDELDLIWEMRSDVNDYFDKGVISHKLDVVLDTIIKRFI